tara:strand:+ start:112 stop:825 length:714 start_codon:yes stop_codon:yes gene_type:complete
MAADRAARAAERAERAEERQAERDAVALTRGNAALADCIVSQCEVLDIGGMRLEDYTAINALTHVKVLMASHTDFDDLGDISGMRQLTELHISNTKILDLTGLASFPHLSVLHFEYALPDVDISPIGRLTSLTELAIGGLSETSDLSFIRNLRRLENLVARWGLGTADISFLRRHPSLRIVEIDARLPEDQSALLTMPRLDAIRLNFFEINPDVRQKLIDRGLMSAVEPQVVAIEVC